MAMVMGILYKKRILTISSTKQNDGKSKMDDEKKPVISTNMEVAKLLAGDIFIPSLNEFERLNDQERNRNCFKTIHGRSKDGESRKIENQILPYDHSRVTITNDKNAKVLINASWVLRPVDEGTYDSVMTFPYLPVSQVGVIVMQIPNKTNLEVYQQMIYQNDVAISLSISNTSINSNIFASIQSKDTSVGSKIYQKFIDRNAIDRKLIREEWDFCLGRFQQFRFSIHFKLQEFSLQSNEAIDRILRTITYIRKDMTTNRQQLIMLIQDEKEGVSEAAIFVALLILLEQFDEAFLSMQNRSGETVFIDIFKTVNELR